MDWSRLATFLLAIAGFALAAGALLGWLERRRIARQLDERDESGAAEGGRASGVTPARHDDDWWWGGA